MIHLQRRTKGKLKDKYAVNFTGANGEPLEDDKTQGFERIEGAYTHMRAMAANFCYPQQPIDQIVFQDETDLANIKSCVLPFDKRKKPYVTYEGPDLRPYIPGKNKK